ncbi:MAG: helicase-related protein [Thermoplasmata archaeon]
MEKIGILDPEGTHPNPLTNKPYSRQYKELAKIWSTYPAYENAIEFLETIAKFQLIFVVSQPGSGKTVLVPKYALHHLKYQGKIAITLPKRILTLSAATFAAKTMDVELGVHVGYLYKDSDKKMYRPENKLVYMTDGSLIMKIVRDPLLREYNVVIVDEAHERKTQIDLLLLFLKKILESGKRPDLKVIIMSATIDANKYKNYFMDIDSKIINLAGKSNHDITVYYLEKPPKSYISSGFKIIDHLIGQGVRKDILFFITTSAEAFQICQIIRKKYPKVYCIELYADMDKNLKIYAESKDKYLELGKYEQKLIIATNVAESSITIDGLTYVIDSGYELGKYFDPETLGNIFEKRLVSKAQAIQRRGRVGRTEPGICYHLLTKEQFEKLPPYPEPDILKQDITLDILKIILITDKKTFSAGSDLLNQLMDPPKKSFVNVSYKLFKLYHLIDSDDKITKNAYLVARFSDLPLNRSLFLIYAYELLCVKEASIIVAMIEALNGKMGNLFVKSKPFCESDCPKIGEKLLKKVSKKKGDHLTFLAIFYEYAKFRNQEVWLKKYGIRSDIMYRAEKLANKYYQKILGFFRDSSSPSRISSTNINKKIVESLKLSHLHLEAKNMVPSYTHKKIRGKISKDSILHYYYSEDELEKKTFVYDELVNINDKWTYNIITLI